MIFALILAGGTGSRMGADMPKQFLNILDKPIIIYTLEKFCYHGGFERIIVLTPDEWIGYTEELITKYLKEYKDIIKVLKGGVSRNDTIINGICYIDEEHLLDDDTVIVTHDAARPFINNRIIDENIDAVKSGGAATTAVPSVDTILYCPNGKNIGNIPDRSVLYQCQTPQTFSAKKFLDIYMMLDIKEREMFTDATGIFVKNGIEVYIVQGENYNIKITYPNDLVIAEAYVKAMSKKYLTD